MGSFYSDIFVSCAAADRKGNAAHFPSIVVEVLSEHVGSEFTKKKHAYLASRDIAEYIIIDSTQRYGIRYSLTPERRLAITEYDRGPVRLEAIDLDSSFEQIYAETDVPPILRPVYSQDEILLE